MSYTKKHFLSVVGLIIGAGIIGFALGVLFGPMDNDCDMYHCDPVMHHEGMDHSMHEGMKHGLQQVEGEVPSVVIEVNEGTMDEISLYLNTKNFTFTPELIDAEEVVQNQGHAHLYVNNEKKGRIYGNWYHLPSSRLTEGSNTIKISLHADNHDTWENEGEIVHHEVIIEK